MCSKTHHVPNTSIGNTEKPYTLFYTRRIMAYNAGQPTCGEVFVQMSLLRYIS